jgi:dTDP-glucose 4,6-dehydratase
VKLLVTGGSGFIGSNFIPHVLTTHRVFGVFTLLEAVRELKIPRFLHISTDEVYGSVERGSLRESAQASEAGGDLLALAYWLTHRVPVVITRSSNNFEPRSSSSPASLRPCSSP